MRTLLSGVFVLLGVVLMPYSGFAAGLTTEHWSVDISETEDMRLNFAVEYLGDVNAAAPTEDSVLEEPSATASSATTEVSAPAESVTLVATAVVNESATIEPATVSAINPPPTDTVSTIVPIGLRDILINEFVSDPVSGANEWVELYNTLPIALELDDWSLEDAA
ncbi:MAG: hypothetical protein AAB570_02155, partial [Patescibacteria group bacterium]